MALNNFSIRGAEATFRHHGFSKSHQLRILDVNGLPDYLRNELIDQNGRVYISQASLPSVKVQNIEVRYQNFPFQLPGQIEFEHVATFTARTPSDFLLRSSLERAVFALANPETTCGGQFPCDSSTLTYAVLGDDCSIVRGYKLIGVYVESVGAIQYNQESMDVVTFDFTLRYQRWEPLDLNESYEAATNEIDAIYQSFESKIATGVGAQCNTKTTIPRV